jgi:hypothetical protein
MPSPARIHHPGRSRRRGVTVSGPARPIVRPPFRAAARLDLPGNAPSPRRSPPAALVPSPFRRAPRRKNAVPRRNPPPGPASSSRRHGLRAGAANRPAAVPSGSPTRPARERAEPPTIPTSRPGAVAVPPCAATQESRPPQEPTTRAGLVVAASRPPGRRGQSSGRRSERQPDSTSQGTCRAPDDPHQPPWCRRRSAVRRDARMPSPARIHHPGRSRRRGVTAPGPARPIVRSPFRAAARLDQPRNAPSPRRPPPAALCRRRSAVRSAMEFGGRAIPWPWRCCHERARTPGSECLRLPAAAAHGERQRDGSREGWVARGSSRSATSGWPSNGERHQGGSREPWVARGSSRSATSGWPSNGERHQGGSREPWVARGSSRSATSWLTLERRTAPGRLARILGHSRLLAVGGIGPTLERRTTLPATSCSSATSAPSRRPWPSRPSRSAPAPSAPPARRDGRDT